MGPRIVRFWVKTSFHQQGHWRWNVAGSFGMTMIPNTPPGQRRSGFVRSISRSWSGLATWKSLEGVESMCCPETAPKHHCSRGDLPGGMGQNTSNSVWKPCEDLQKTFDLCHCQQRIYNKVLRNFCYWPNTYFPRWFANKLIKNPTMWLSGFFSLILSVIVEVYLWWKLQASLIFLSGRTCTIGGWLNTFLPHCNSHP